MKKVLCIGGVTADIVVHPVKQLPEPGTLKVVEGINTFVGGCAANVAIDLGILGVPVSLCCKIGEDTFGNFVMKKLEEYNVDISGTTVDKKTGTSVSIVVVDDTGERSFLYNPGATSEFTSADIADTLIRECDIVFIASALLLTKFDGMPAAKLLERAQKAGKYTVMDTVWDFEDKWMAKIKPSLSYLDLFMPSVDEAMKLTGEVDIDKIADVFFEIGAKNVIIKLGSKGAYICEVSGDRYLSASFLQPDPIDTNGAGDSFCAGFLCGLASGKNYKMSARLANAVGSHCVTSVGAYSGIRPMNEIEAFLQKAGGEENE